MYNYLASAPGTLHRANACPNVLAKSRPARIARGSYTDSYRPRRRVRDANEERSRSAAQEKSLA